MKPDCDVLRAKDYDVRIVALRHCERMTVEFHYSGGGSNTGTFCHGLFRKDSWDMLGMAWWIPPTKSSAIATFPEGRWQDVLVLTRLVVRPEVPQNGESFLLGRSMKMIERDQRFKCLVTYADTWRGHTGAIYRATNWQYLGLTQPEAVWVDKDGRMVARKAGPKTRTKAEMLALDFTMLGKFSKHKFRKVIE